MLFVQTFCSKFNAPLPLISILTNPVMSKSAPVCLVVKCSAACTGDQYFADQPVLLGKFFPFNKS